MKTPVEEGKSAYVRVNPLIHRAKGGLPFWGEDEFPFEAGSRYLIKVKYSSG